MWTATIPHVAEASHADIMALMVVGVAAKLLQHRAACPSDSAALTPRWFSLSTKAYFLLAEGIWIATDASATRIQWISLANLASFSKAAEIAVCATCLGDDS